MFKVNNKYNFEQVIIPVSTDCHQIKFLVGKTHSPDKDISEK